MSPEPRPLLHRVLPLARGVEPTCDDPAPLDPELLADIVRPPIPPGLVDALVAGLLDAVLADLEQRPAEGIDDRPADSASRA